MFIIWSVSSFVLEIPGGIVADRFSRRRLAVCGALVTGLGFTLWTVAAGIPGTPTYPAFAAGFVLWALGGALRGSAITALLYDELAVRGQARTYPRVAGRVRAAGAVGILLGTALAGPLVAGGGYVAAGVASVCACLVCAGATALLPESARPRHSSGEQNSDTEADGGQHDSWRSILAGATAAIRRSGRIRRAIVVIIALTWVGALDEYLPVLTRELLGATATPAAVAALMIVVAGGDIVGSLAAGISGSRRAMPWILAAGSLCLIVGVAAAHPIGIIGVAIAFAAYGWALVVADAALQDQLDSRTRATVGSVVGVGEEMIAIVAFTAWAAGSTVMSASAMFACAALPYVVLSGVLGARTSRAPGR